MAQAKDRKNAVRKHSTDAGLSKEIKAITSYYFFPQHYFNEALSADSQALGGKGERISKSKAKFEAALQDCKDQASKLDLIDFVLATFGFNDVTCDHNFKFSFHHGAKPCHIQVSQRITLRKEAGELWVLSAPDLAEINLESKVELFLTQVSPAQSSGKEDTLTWKQLVDDLFSSDQAAVEWLLISSGTDLYLIDRGRWQEEGEAFLRIDLRELYALNDPVLYRLADVLFSTAAFPIQTANFLHETLAQNAHKKAAQVTKALRDTVRESIEILGNAVLRHHKKTPLKAWQGRDLKEETDRKQCARELQEQAIRCVYRMLFLLFTESQSRNALPIHSKVYQLGYAFEKLRNLEGIPLATTEASGAGNFIQRTVERTTQIYFTGFNQGVLDPDATDALGFQFPAVGTDLFDLAATPLITESVISDHDFQKIVGKLSLARTGKGRHIRTYRVHYAGLGLNQLGAVYEGLLSLRPEILEEKVVLLTKEDKEHAHRYVPFTEVDKLQKEQLLLDDNGNVVTRPNGAFLLSPLGLDRKLSASFYTAETLTRFLAREAVDTLLEKDASLGFMENLKILEPAMGSGAFLNAVVDELAPKMAKEYEKQYRAQRGEEAANTEAAPFETFKAKAKEHLMAHAIYGVDLNPTAVELAKVSLWLNCLHKDGNLPFLDFKLRTGNSLVGAWIHRHKHETGFQHFLFPPAAALDPHLEGSVLGGAAFVQDKKERSRLEELKASYNSTAKDPKSLQRIAHLSSRITQLYLEHLQSRKAYREAVQAKTNPIEKSKIYQEYCRKSSAFNQLRGMMDLWCSLWFWPHSELDLAPAATDFLEALEWLAEVKLEYDSKAYEDSGFEFLSVSRGVAKREKFFHWDLEFAEVFEKGGFDIVIGNPPWAPVRWEEEDFFEERAPGIAAMVGDAKQKITAYSSLLANNAKWVAEYKNEAARRDGLVTYLRHSGTYPYADASKANTYKYFYQRFFQVTAQERVHAMIAQDGILTDDGGLEMRPTFLRELRKMYRFKNEKNVFEDVDHHVKFMCWTAQGGSQSVDFELVDNLFHPETVSLCKHETVSAPYRGLKDEMGKFELRGHPKRIVHINEDVLKDLAKFSGHENPLQADVPIIHGQVELELLRAFAKHPLKLHDVSFVYSQSWNETNAPKDGFITFKPGRPKDISEAVLTGPNIFVGNPANKSINPTAKHNLDFSDVDLTSTPEDFFPDVKYQLTDKGRKSADYLEKTPWGRQMTSEYRLMLRGMVSTTGARTLSSAIIPPGPSHIHSCSTLTFKAASDLSITAGLFNSILYDFLMRSVSGGTIGQAVLKMAPVLTDNQIHHPLVAALQVRALRLASISIYYKQLWKDQFDPSFREFECDSPYVPKLAYSKLSGEWKYDTCIRHPKQREQALCEIDAITAILFGIDKETLLNLYRSQFGVLQGNLFDLPNQEVPKEKEAEHFPRYNAMVAAYDQALNFVEQRKKANGKKAA